MSKSRQEIQMEYFQLCAQLGELHLRRASAQDAIKDMNDQCNTITQKVRNLQKAVEALPEEQATPEPAPAPLGALAAQPEPSSVQPGESNVQS